jgi:hypothetical protein
MQMKAERVDIHVLVTSSDFKFHLAQEDRQHPPIDCNHLGLLKGYGSVLQSLPDSPDLRLRPSPAQNFLQ